MPIMILHRESYIVAILGEALTCHHQ